MKLINAEFNLSDIDDRLYNKDGRMRVHRWFPVRSDIDFECTEHETESLLRGAYKAERNWHPRKQGMRKKYVGRQVHVDYWDERPGRTGHYTWRTIDNKLYGHINKYIGKKFDDCLSALKERVTTNKDWQVQACGFGSNNDHYFIWFAWRNRFLSVFEDSRWSKADYYVDEAGYIRQRPKKVYPRKKKQPKPRRRKPVDNSAYYDRSMAVTQFMKKNHEDGFTFHNLMAKGPVQIRKENLIRGINKIYKDPYKYAAYFRVTKEELYNALDKIRQSDWIDRTSKSSMLDPEYVLHYKILEIL